MGISSRRRQDDHIGTSEGSITITQVEGSPINTNAAAVYAATTVATTTTTTVATTTASQSA